MTTRLNKVLEHLHRVFAPPDGGPTDGQLLARFVAIRDEGAFAALVRRHGPMVLGVCRRLLRHAQDTEDAFQATFLVLVRKASVVKGEAVGSWLYAVAYRTALEARAVNARRRARERQMDDMPHPEVTPVEPQDWRPRLDQELSRLPENYRSVIVACDLEGFSRKEAARLLGLAEGTVSSRLARGRRLLAKRLSRYGLSLSSGALSMALSESASAVVPASLVSATAKAAVLVAAGHLAAISSSVGILTKGVLKTMFIAKLKLLVGAMVVVTALGATGLAYHASGQSTSAEKQPAEKRPLTELESLRRQNELLKLNLEVVLEKVRAQETELRALRTAADKAKEETSGFSRLRKPTITATTTYEQQLVPIHHGPAAPVTTNSWSYSWSLDPLQEVEAALKALREIRDPEAKRRAADVLEKAVKKLREQLKKNKQDYPSGK